MLGFFASMDKRRAAFIVLTLFIAFAAGEIMQQGASREDIARSGDAPKAAPIVETESGIRALPVPPAATLRPLDPPAVLPERVEEFDPPTLDEVRFSPFGEPCDPIIRLSPSNRGYLDISAPCAGWQMVQVGHFGPGTDVYLDRFGRASVPLRDAAAVQQVDLALGGHTWTLRIVKSDIDGARIAEPAE